MTVNDPTLEPAPKHATAPGLRKDLDLGALREKLARDQGRAFWRSLDEAASSPEFEAMIHREFPQAASEWQSDGDGLDRRNFLQLMSASIAFGGLAACTRQPLEKIVPYVRQPEQIVPGRPLYFATGLERDGYAHPLLAESHMGRPTKIEGNPEAAASLGATDLYAQASILELYDPDRRQTVSELGRIRTWSTFVAALGKRVEEARQNGGLRLRLLTGPTSSPTLARLIEKVHAEHPQARWHQYAPLSRGNSLAAWNGAFGRPLSATYDFSRAERVVALDADFLAHGPGAVRYARDFMAARKVRAGVTKINRLYAFESSPSATGSVADHRRALSTAELSEFAAALAAAVGGGNSRQTGELAELAAIVAKDLENHRGRSLVIAGEQCPSEVQILAHWLNDRLGNAGSTVSYHQPITEAPTDDVASLETLVDDMNAGEVDILVVLGGNPVFDAPADLDFAAAMQKVEQCIRLSLADDETSEYCHWNLPAAHYLESWGDGRAYDGTVILTQPLIEPLYAGRSATELLSLLTADGSEDGESLLRATWAAHPGGSSEAAWRKSLHDGLIDGTAAPSVEASFDSSAFTKAAATATAAASDELELCFRPDPTIYDGRYANNGWLQECPKPLSKLTWDNPLLISPALAERLGLAHEQLVELTVDGRTLELPLWVHPGQAENSLTLTLGYGRRRAGRVATGVGFDAYSLRSSHAPWTAAVSLKPTAGSMRLASTQLHSNIETDRFQGTNLEGRAAEERHLVRAATIEQFTQQPDFPQHPGHDIDGDLSLMPGYDYSQGHKWGLSIDLNACTSCNACVIACQSENNIPVVGKEQVIAGREMHWIRIDRYYQGELEDPQIHHQPVMCMHCEQAPCEVVCPVAATVHSSEGLNDMVYNRCVGTRYCANNCPYKVRRFNFFKYVDDETESLKLMRNPDVTVRSRGVMEKCSYCVQRISQATITARKEDRRVRDGEVKTACQQVCPTGAIVFGDLNDETSAVAERKAQPHDYGILTELGTRPRTTYLAKVGNPNPRWPNPHRPSPTHGAEQQHG